MEKEPDAFERSLGVYREVFDMYQGDETAMVMAIFLLKKKKNQSLKTQRSIELIEKARAIMPPSRAPEKN